MDAYKFDAAYEARQSLAALLARQLPRHVEWTVATVPTARAHIRQLGYDHATSLAKEIARLQRVPYAPLLQRSKQAVQHQSSRQARLRQVRELFTASGPMPREVLLVDDVLTTGATLEAAARVLKAAGAQRVYGAVIVRQPLD